MSAVQSVRDSCIPIAYARRVGVGKRTYAENTRVIWLTRHPIRASSINPFPLVARRLTENSVDWNDQVFPRALARYELAKPRSFRLAPKDRRLDDTLTRVLCRSCRLPQLE